MIKQLLILGLGCALGGMARFSVTYMLDSLLGRTFPWGTLGVNLIGSFLIGMGFIYLVERPVFTLALAYQLRLLLLVGLLGSFTTFSTFSLDSITLIQNGHLGLALIYILASVLLCLLATYSGLTLARLY